MMTTANTIKKFSGDNSTTRHAEALAFAKQYAEQWGIAVTVKSGMYDDLVLAGEHAGGTVCRPAKWTEIVDGVSISITEAAGVMYADLPRMDAKRAWQLLQSVKTGDWMIGNSASMDAKTIGASISI